MPHISYELLLSGSFTFICHTSQDQHGAVSVRSQSSLLILIIKKKGFDSVGSRRRLGLGAVRLAVSLHLNRYNDDIYCSSGRPWLS